MVTLEQRRRLLKSKTEIEDATKSETVDPILRKGQIEGIEALIGDLEDELNAYIRCNLHLAQIIFEVHQYRIPEHRDPEEKTIEQQ